MSLRKRNLIVLERTQWTDVDSIGGSNDGDVEIDMHHEGNTDENDSDSDIFSPFFGSSFNPFFNIFGNPAFGLGGQQSIPWWKGYVLNVYYNALHSEKRHNWILKRAGLCSPSYFLLYFSPRVTWISISKKYVSRYHGTHSVALYHDCRASYFCYSAATICDRWWMKHPFIYTCLIIKWKNCNSTHEQVNERMCGNSRSSYERDQTAS